MKKLKMYPRNNAYLNQDGPEAEATAAEVTTENVGNEGNCDNETQD